MALEIYTDACRLYNAAGVAGPTIYYNVLQDASIVDKPTTNGWVVYDRSFRYSELPSRISSMLNAAQFGELSGVRLKAYADERQAPLTRENRVEWIRNIFPNTEYEDYLTFENADTITAQRVFNNAVVDPNVMYSLNSGTFQVGPVNLLEVVIYVNVWQSVINNGRFDLTKTPQNRASVGISYLVTVFENQDGSLSYSTVQSISYNVTAQTVNIVQGGDLYNAYNATRPYIRQQAPYDGVESEEHDSGAYSPDSSDQIPISELPSLSSADTGFTTIYNPNIAQLRSLASYLWSDESFPQTIWNHVRQLVENPMDVMISLSIVPCPVPAGGTQEFKVLLIGTGIQITKAASQFVQVDCGTCTINRLTEFGSALDYNPYTQISCFLPYIGEVNLDTDEVMGTTLHCYYRIDIVTGACVAIIEVDGSVRYQFSGDCAVYIPFSAADFTAYKGAIVQAAKLVASGISAGMGVPEFTAAGTGVVQTTNEIVDTVRNPETGRQIKAGTTKETTTTSMQSTKATYRGISSSGISNTVGAVIGSKFNVQHSGGFSGNSGYLGIRRPYLTIKRPRLCNPAEYGNYNGYPSMLTLSLGECTGYTQVQQIRLRNLTATEPEQDEILQFLKGGVIL